MITVVFILGLLNLALGFALAVLLERPLVLPAAWSWPALRLPSAWSGLQADTALPVNAGKTWQAEGLHDRLLERLQVEGIEPASFLEATLWTVKLELGPYRLELVRVDGQQRAEDDSALEAALAAALAASTAWEQRLNDLATQLCAHQQEEFETLKTDVEETMLDHVFQVQTITGKIRKLAAQDGTSHDVTDQVCHLIAAVDSLSEFAEDALAEILRLEQRLACVPEPLLSEPTSTVLTRLGMESLFADWWTRDQERIRLVSCALVDLDRFKSINQQWGAAVGDKIVAAFGVLLQDLLRKERGFDRVARLGQAFLLFLGDTACRNATSGVERIRQTIEATSFRLADANLQVTVSGGVIEVGKTEQLPQLLTRLKKCVVEAKKAGRNRSVLDSGKGPQPIELPQYKVEGRVIQL